MGVAVGNFLSQGASSCRDKAVTGSNANVVSMAGQERRAARRVLLVMLDADLPPSQSLAPCLVFRSVSQVMQQGSLFFVIKGEPSL